jgi:activator of HSP90 ATPase
MLPSNVWASADHGAESGAMGTKPIHMVEDFSVSPERVYGALLDGKQFHEITGQRSEIDPVPGGAFNIFNDRIVGRNLELVKNQGIVQAWREPAWDDGVYSIVRFDIKTQGSGTRLVFDHWGFPEAGRPHLIIGWKEHYFEPMRKYFAERAGRSPC